MPACRLTALPPTASSIASTICRRSSANGASLRELTCARGAADADEMDDDVAPARFELDPYRHRHFSRQRRGDEHHRVVGLLLGVRIEPGDLAHQHVAEM